MRVYISRPELPSRDSGGSGNSQCHLDTLNFWHFRLIVIRRRPAHASRLQAQTRIQRRPRLRRPDQPCI